MPVATEDALTGVGVPAQLAVILGAQPAVVVAKGTSQTTAAVLTSRGAEITAASSQTGVIPDAASPIMTPFALTNSSATTAIVYVPVGHSLNGSSNGRVYLSQNKSIYFLQYKSKKLTYILTA